MFTLRLLSVLLAGNLLLMAGCSNDDATAQGKKANDGTEAKSGEKTTGEAAQEEEQSKKETQTDSKEAPKVEVPITLEVGTGEDLEKLIAAHKGKVVLVDFWATFCPPCMAKFPHIVSLYEKHSDDLVVISVSGDDPDSSFENALNFLKKNNARFPNLISKFGIGTETGESFKFPGGFPHYRLYDHTGTLRYNHTDFADDLNADEWVGLELIETGGEGEPVVNLLDKRILELIAERKSN